MPYYNWTYRPAPQARAGSYRRKYGTSWWGKKFLEALEEMDYSGRLARGRTYANKGLVLELNATAPGKLDARVQGSFPQPYEISLVWTPWSEQERQQVLDLIADNPAVLSGLLAGQLPEPLFDALDRAGIEVFPKNYKKMRVVCSCPDYAVPCKHQAAVFYVLAAEIDADPFRLLELRGLDLRSELAKRYGTAATRHAQLPRTLDLIQDIAEPPAYAWDEVRYQLLDFSVITDAGLRAVRQLPGEVPFDAGTDLPNHIERIYKKTARFAARQYGAATERSTAELNPTGGLWELHLDENWQLISLEYFSDEEDKSLAQITDEAALLDRLRDLEQADRYPMDAETRSLVLGFQVARKLAVEGGFLPEIWETEEGKNMIRYRPALADEATRELFEEIQELSSPRLLYYSADTTNIREFRPETRGLRLVSYLLSMLVRRAHPDQYEDTPTRRLFLAQGAERFDLVGTEGFPAGIGRWLQRLTPAEGRYRPLLRVTESGAGFLLDVLVADRDQPNKLPREFSKWFKSKKVDPSDRLALLQILGNIADSFSELNAYLAGAGTTPLYYLVNDFTPVMMEILPALEALGLEVLLPAQLRKLLRPRLGIRADARGGVEELSGIISLEQMLSFRWQTALGDEALNEEDFRKLLKQQNGLVQFKDRYAYIDPAEVERILKKLDEGDPSLKVHEKLQAVFTEELDGAQVWIDDELRTLLDAWRNGPEAEVPVGIRATLRPYQLRGYQWLYANANFGFGSVLADDMGLGKTLQVITLLEKIREEGGLMHRKALAVVPTSLLGNWQREVAKFAPDLRTATYHGSNRKLPDPKSYDLLLTTYGLARSEEKVFTKMDLQALVIDESQAIKNPAAKQTKAIKKIPATVRVAMSGTPVENKLLDYWSVLDFTLPKYLGTQTYFRKNYARPIQGERDQRTAERFRRLVAPFVLRRLKTDKHIISDLPDKVVQTEHCALTPEQLALYQSIVDENLRAAEEADGVQRQGLIFKLMTALKQCCNHPDHFLKRNTGDFGASGKSLLLRERLQGILESNDKTLIFTQYREMGDLLVQMIQKEYGIEPPFLHGGSSPKQRDAMVERFQTDPGCPIFLLSIKAGGTGLNLTAANHVIHYDLWWNPAVENQATDRAYRIGQDRTVFVHRLVTEKTFEEKIDELIRSKTDLADLTVGTGETWVGKLSNSDLRKLVAV